MNKVDPEIVKRALLREKAARKQAEQILEEKSRELYSLTQKLKTTNNKLEELFDNKNKELKGVFRNLVDAYVMIDTEGNVLDMNESAINLFGYNITKEKLNVISLLYKEDFEYGMLSFQQLISEGFFKDYKARVYTKHNGIRSVHINASLIKNKNNDIIGAQGIVRDITEQLQQEKQKEELLKNLKRSNKELKDFAHVVSHDLKSPLHSMNALVNWLKEDYGEVLDDFAVKSFNSLLLKIEKMDHLIDGILKYSSIDRRPVLQNNIDLNNIISDIIEIIHVPDNFEISILSKLPIIKGDRFKLQQLFQNLINNAIKYNDKEHGKLEINCKEKRKVWEFSIADNGPGIPEQHHDKIFEIFQTLKNSNESTGVGLSIVKKIVDLYDGSIQVFSEKDIGTKFLITLKKDQISN